MSPFGISQFLVEFNGQLIQKVLHAYPTWTARGKAAFVVVCVLGLSIIVVALAYHTGHAYLPLVALGIFYGWLLSYPVMKFFGPTLQAAVGSFLGGISIGNIGSKEDTVRSAIQTVASKIVTLVEDIGPSVVNPASPPSDLKWNWMDTAVVYCIWMAIITLFLIVVLNAYFSSKTQTANPYLTCVPALGSAEPPSSACRPEEGRDLSSGGTCLSLKKREEGRNSESRLRRFVGLSPLGS